jgi:hypothetical protein
MEVASPLTFGSAGAKRHYPGSPPAFAVDDNMPFAMIADSTSASEEYGSQQQQRAFKRRRFNDESMDSDSENTQNHSFPSHASVPKGSFFHQGTFFSRSACHSLFHDAAVFFRGDFSQSNRRLCRVG